MLADKNMNISHYFLSFYFCVCLCLCVIARAIREQIILFNLVGDQVNYIVTYLDDMIAIY